MMKISVEKLVGHPGWIVVDRSNKKFPYLTPSIRSNYPHIYRTRELARKYAKVDFFGNPRS